MLELINVCKTFNPGTEYLRDIIAELSGGDVKQLALLVVQILAVKTDCQRLALRLVTDPQQ